MQAFNSKDTRAVHFDWESLKRTGWSKLNMPDAPFADGGFTTPSGKCEFFSESMLADGLDPVPTYIPPYESVASNPELAKTYPLAMISPPARNFLNSTFVNVQSLRATEGEPHLDIHPNDAARRGILHELVHPVAVQRHLLEQGDGCRVVGHAVRAGPVDRRSAASGAAES